MSGSVLCEGTLYVNQIVSGVFQGLEKWPGLAKLEIKPNSELKEATTKDIGQYGQIVAAVGITKPSELSVTLSQVTGNGLAIAMQGSLLAYSAGSATVTNQNATAKLGKFIELGKYNITDGTVVVKNSGETVTYVNGTDYRVNYAMGFVEILSTGAITDNQALKISFSAGAVTGNRILGGTQPQVRGQLFLDGKNLADGKPFKMTIWEALLTTDNPVDFMSDNFIDLAMKGRMITPTGKASAYEILHDAAFV